MRFEIGRKWEKEWLIIGTSLPLSTDPPWVRRWILSTSWLVTVLCLILGIVGGGWPSLSRPSLSDQDSAAHKPCQVCSWRPASSCAEVPTLAFECFQLFSWTCLSSFFLVSFWIRQVYSSANAQQYFGKYAGCRGCWVRTQVCSCSIFLESLTARFVSGSHSLSWRVHSESSGRIFAPVSLAIWRASPASCSSPSPSSPLLLSLVLSDSKTIKVWLWKAGSAAGSRKRKGASRRPVPPSRHTKWICHHPMPRRCYSSN